MASASLSQISTVINQHIQSSEDFEEILGKLDALTRVTLCDDFFDFPTTVLHDYFWNIQDVILHARETNRYRLDQLLRQRQHIIDDKPLVN